MQIFVPDPMVILWELYGYFIGKAETNLRALLEPIEVQLELINLVLQIGTKHYKNSGILVIKKHDIIEGIPATAPTSVPL